MINTVEWDRPDGEAFVIGVGGMVRYQTNTAGGWAAMPYIINWNRAQKTATYRMPRDVMDCFATGEDPAFLVCRQMVSAGMPDGEAVVIDERGVRCWLIKSIHGAARLHHPTSEEAAERAAEIKAEKERKKK